MRAAHLLGENWEWTRWYDSAAARDEAYAGLARQFTYYRTGDRPSVVLAKIEQDF
jgi:hypothetical protein